MAGIRELVAEVEGGKYLTISQVAQELGRTAETIRRWQKNKKVQMPTHKMPLGKEGGDYFVWLYTTTDIESYKKYADGIVLGRPKREEK